MQFLTNSECAEWAKRRGYPVEELHPGWFRLNRKLPSPPYNFVPIDYPKDSGKKAYLAKVLYSHFEESSEFLLWLSDWSVWPSGEHMPLFDRFRESLGEKQTIDKTPGHLI